MPREPEHRSLWSYAPENLIYLGSFSKVFSPGVRVGWMVAPTDVRGYAQIASEFVTICAFVLSQRIVAEFMGGDLWMKHTSQTSKLYKQRRDAVIETIRSYLPEDTIATVPDGGFFTWVTLPSKEGEVVDVEELLHKAIDRGVVFVPGSAFFSDPHDGAGTLRIAFSYGEPETLAEGVRRLRQALKD
ncbi:PLP-dependent aminotransferase family protein [Corynebacterium argentoratense]|uniref:PLP-dependent aminotransferase family protein n=1 Tax=Corynebacterium argentoratense TaxID=42817 RepID=UPI0028D69EF2|nr:PLP-dependent aminotransferase family protein [Corynebacterium argentoratense]